MSEVRRHQGVLSGVVPDPAGAACAAAERVKAAVRLKPVNRSQMTFRVIQVERLVEQDHPARAIWAFVSRLDLSAFYGSIKAVDGVAGREAWEAKLLISLWLHAYSRGIGSAREAARRYRGVLSASVRV